MERGGERQRQRERQRQSRVVGIEAERVGMAQHVMKQERIGCVQRDAQHNETL